MIVRLFEKVDYFRNVIIYEWRCVEGKRKEQRMTQRGMKAESGQVKDNDRAISIDLARVFALLCSLSVAAHTFLSLCFTPPI